MNFRELKSDIEYLLTTSNCDCIDICKKQQKLINFLYQKLIISESKNNIMPQDGVEELITLLLNDDERNDFVDHDFQCTRYITEEQIEYINKKMEGKTNYKIISCEHNIPYNTDELTCAAPYFVYTEKLCS